MKLAHPKGLLFVIGGGEDKEGDCTILAEFVRFAGGNKARLVVMTVATDEPEEVGREYQKVFRRLGVKSARVVDVSARSDASDKKLLAALKQATGIFFTGGDQLHVTSLIGGSEMDLLLHQLYERGVVIGGTSAGAAMMSNSMIIGGTPEENPKVGAVEIGPGMDLIVGAVIDTHFSQRGRFGRLLTAIAHYPQDLGLGLDEKTAMIVNRNEFEVAGEGAVTVIDGGAMTYTSLPYAERGDGLSLYGVRVHVLSAGARFDLSKREPVVERDDDAPKRGKASDDEDHSASPPSSSAKKNKGK
jgi:cyanophycinase